MPIDPFSPHFSVRILGDSALRGRAAEIETFDAGLERLIAKMMRTLLEGQIGVGLAAPQVGVSKRVVVYDPDYAEGPGVLINPQIVKATGSEMAGEGCLSVPGDHYPIERPAYARVSTRTADGGTIEVEGGATFARLAHHEIEHLNGVLVVDHLPPTQQTMAHSLFRKHLQQTVGDSNVTALSMDQVDRMFRTGRSR